METTTLPGRWWVSWYGAGGFEYHGPWWITGHDLQGDRATICAAVLASSEADARRVISEAHDAPTPAIEWRFTEARPADWSPFGDRFERATWMQWPAPEPPRIVGAGTRAEHVALCKARALAELDAPREPVERRVTNALASLQSDLPKHPDTRRHDAIELSMMLAIGGHLQTEAQVREWIEGVQ